MVALTLKIVGHDITFMRAPFLLSVDRTIASVGAIAQALANAQGTSSSALFSNAFVYDENTGDLLDKDQPCRYYYPQGGSATLRVEFRDYANG